MSYLLILFIHSTRHRAVRGSLCWYEAGRYHIDSSRFLSRNVSGQLARLHHPFAAVSCFLSHTPLLSDTSFLFLVLSYFLCLLLVLYFYLNCFLRYLSTICTSRPVRRMYLSLCSQLVSTVSLFLFIYHCLCSLPNAHPTSFLLCLITSLRLSLYPHTR